MKSKNHKEQLFESKPKIIEKDKIPVRITANVCIEKGICSRCDSGKSYFGVPLVFVLHFSDKSIESICYKCGIKIGRRMGFKIPLTEEDIYNSVIAKDRKR